VTSQQVSFTLEHSKVNQNVSNVITMNAERAVVIIMNDILIITM